MQQGDEIMHSMRSSKCGTDKNFDMQNQVAVDIARTLYSMQGSCLRQLAQRQWTFKMQIAGNCCKQLIKGIFTTCYWAHSTLTELHTDVRHFWLYARWLVDCLGWHYDPCYGLFYLMTLFVAHSRSIKPVRCYEDRIEQLKLRLIPTRNQQWIPWNYDAVFNDSTYCTSLSIKLMFFSIFFPLNAIRSV